MSLHLRQGECFGRGGSRWGDSRDWRLYGSGFTVAGRLCWCSRVPRGWWVLHTRACSVLVGIAESCGTALSVTVMALLPCADPTSPHMGARPPHTTLTRKARHSNNNQPPTPHRPRPPMCNTNDNHTHHDTPTTPHTEIGPLPARDRSNSARPTRRRSTHDKLRGQSHMPHLRTVDEQQTRGSTTDLNAKLDRSRHGLRPISRRKRTDLGTGYDRSRREFRPISWRNRTDLGEGVVRG